jgi:hypothetical protein
MATNQRSNSNANQLPDRDSSGQLPSYAWPGGYQLQYLTADGLTICPSCANQSDTSDPVVAGDVYWEGPEVPCDDCGAMLESAYGDPEADMEPEPEPSDGCPSCGRVMLCKCSELAELDCGPVANPDGSPSDLTRAMLAGTGRDPVAFAGAADRGRALVCGDCWAELRPDEYEPEWTVDGECSRCGQWAGGVHRVSWAEVDANPTRCGWLARCTNRATHLVRMPAGVFPACDACHPVPAPTGCASYGPGRPVGSD